MTGRVRVQEFRSLRRNSLRCFATVQFPSGLLVAEPAIHRPGPPPGRPWSKGIELVLDASCNPKWKRLIKYAAHSIRSSPSRQVVAAVRDAYPETPADDRESAA
jgi:hypothetical protein